MENDPLQLITTSDGSHTLFNARLNETYHSHHGAIRESEHVFIDKGLKYVHDQQGSGPVSILEVGFGTGLNALLSLRFSDQSDTPVSYTSIEPFPLDEYIWSRLNYASSLSEKENFRALHLGSWGEEIQLAKNFRILKLRGELQATSLSHGFYDLVFFDAFAPNKQPEMWEISVLSKVADSIKNNGVLVTYCAKGQVKRDLKKLGFLVESLQGPPGKKEMIRAIKLMSSR